MAKGRRSASKKDASQPSLSDGLPVNDFRHAAKRKNNPPAKIAGEGTVPAVPKAQYTYSPRRPPALRFDPAGGPDALPALLATARTRPLTAEETSLLAEALRTQEPWLEWASKSEQQRRGHFEVDPVALHIHERVSAQAILKVAARQDVQRDLFADPQQQYHEAVQFYRHDVDWANRLILGDSLAVMSSLARREDLAGKVQMIYLDPPYGIKFASNFQPEVGRRDVKDKEQDLTREPEMVRAYRDTWHLGIHSYLSYLRDRLIVARELLADTGSIFVQIGDENLHRVTNLMDEVFGGGNAVCLVVVKKTSPLGSKGLASVADYLVWYARDGEKFKYRDVYIEHEVGSDRYFNVVEDGTGLRRPMTADEQRTPATLPTDARVLASDNLQSSGLTPSCVFPVELDGGKYMPPSNKSWRTNPSGMHRLGLADRLIATGSTLRYVTYFDDFRCERLFNLWTDTGGGAMVAQKLYVVQTPQRVIERCMLMSTDPGDLVLDPTCGSGTTAYVAEQWGRRWITIDTSRVAIAIARQRLLTAKFDFYDLRRLEADDHDRNPRGQWLLDPDDKAGGPRTFRCQSVPHITLKSIAQNTNLDPIFARHEPLLDAALKRCNEPLKRVTPELRRDLEAKLARKQRDEGKKAISDADRRRWVLPPVNREKGAKTTVDVGFAGWYHWEVPFDTDPLYPKELAEAVMAYRAAWRAKMDEVNACIAANASSEELVDKPEVVRGVTRVSGPFTVEAVQPPELSLGENVDPHTGQPAAAGGFGDEPKALPEGFAARTLHVVEPFAETQNIVAYLDQMLRLLRTDGVRFPNNKQMQFTRLEATYQSGNSSPLHAEGRWVVQGQTDDDPQGKATVAVAFGPQYGPVSASMVEQLIRAAARTGYEDLVIAAFSFDGAAQTVIEEAGGDRGLRPAGGGNMRIHMANIRPDVNPGMNGLLKEQPGAQLFTVFGQPRTRLDGPDADGMYTLTMEGVDIYDPVGNVVVPTEAEKVAAWFLDSDFDGRTFCITQAFFPDRGAWEKLARALNGKDGPIDAERFEALSGTKSLPFAVGKHQCAAVKVIDPRGNEVMKVHRL